jgi:hypothetical protein
MDCWLNPASANLWMVSKRSHVFCRVRIRPPRDGADAERFTTGERHPMEQKAIPLQYALKGLVKVLHQMKDIRSLNLLGRTPCCADRIRFSWVTAENRNNRMLLEPGGEPLR